MQKTVDQFFMKPKRKISENGDTLSSCKKVKTEEQDKEIIESNDISINGYDSEKENIR